MHHARSSGLFNYNCTRLDYTSYSIYGTYIVDKGVRVIVKKTTSEVTSTINGSA